MARRRKTEPVVETRDPLRFTPGPMEVPDTAARMAAERDAAKKALTKESVRFKREFLPVAATKNPDVGTEKSGAPARLYTPRGAISVAAQARRRPDVEYERAQRELQERAEKAGRQPEVWELEEAGERGLPGKLGPKGELYFPPPMKYSSVKRERGVWAPTGDDPIAAFVKRGAYSDLVARFIAEGMPEKAARERAGRDLSKRNLYPDIIGMSNEEYAELVDRMRRKSKYWSAVTASDESEFIKSYVKARQDIADLPVAEQAEKMAELTAAVAAFEREKRRVPGGAVAPIRRRAAAGETGPRQSATDFLDDWINRERSRGEYGGPQAKTAGRAMTKRQYEEMERQAKEQARESRGRGGRGKVQVWRRGGVDGADVFPPPGFGVISTPVLGIGALAVVGLGAFTLYKLFQADKPKAP